MTRLRIACGLVVAGVILATTQTTLLACPVCYRVERGPVTDGVQAAVLVLIGVTGTVLAGFAMFAARLVRHSRALDSGVQTPTPVAPVAPASRNS